MSKARIIDSESEEEGEFEEVFADLDPRFGAIVTAQLKASDYTKSIEISSFDEGLSENCDRSLWPSDFDSNITITAFRPKCFS